MPSLLLICPHFPPIAASGAFRMLGFAQHLPKFGWDVSVVACSPVSSEPTDAGLAAQIPPVTAVTRVAFPQGRIANIIGRGLRYSGMHDRYWHWGRHAAAICRRLAHDVRFDAVLTSGPPHSVHRLGQMMKSSFATPWVADFRDPWVSNSQTRGRMRLVKAREAAVLRNADTVIANAPNAQKAFAQAYPASRDKLVTITNGYDPESVPQRRMRRMAEDPIDILHAGELYAGRDPRPLLDAIGDVHRARASGAAFRITFLGRGEWAGFSLAGEIERRGLRQVVRLLDHVPYDDARQRMVDADVLLLLDAEHRTIGVPAKLYEYIGCNRPVFALAEQDGDTAWALKVSGVPHRIARPADVGGIGEALRELLAIAEQSTDAKGPNTGNGPFTREESARLLAEVLDTTRIRMHDAAAEVAVVGSVL